MISLRERIMNLSGGALLILLIVVLTWGGQAVSVPGTVRTPVPDTDRVPECVAETGETQPLCVWPDGPEGPFYNIDYGRYTYTPATGDVTDWEG